MRRQRHRGKRGRSGMDTIAYQWGVTAAQTVNPGGNINFVLLQMPPAVVAVGVPPQIDRVDLVEVKGNFVFEVTQSLAVLDTNLFNWGLYVAQDSNVFRDVNSPTDASFDDWLLIDGGLFSGTLTTPVGINQFTYRVPSVPCNWKGRKPILPGEALAFVVSSSSANLDSLVVTPFVRTTFDRVA